MKKIILKILFLKNESNRKPPTPAPTLQRKKKERKECQCDTTYRQLANMSLNHLWSPKKFIYI